MTTEILTGLIALVFVIGYFLIIFEPHVLVNKASTALFAGALAWILYLNFGEGSLAGRLEQLYEHLSGISQVLFFLIGAMTIVELINAHRGFDVMGALFKGRSNRSAYWIVLFVAFFLSSILDNLTTLIVLVCLLKGFVHKTAVRRTMALALVFAVNAGGAWTVIGDVTTTLLWIQGYIHTLGVSQALFLPSFVSMVVFGAVHQFQLEQGTLGENHEKEKEFEGSRKVLVVGLISLAIVPLLKLTLNVPPFMGVLFSLSVMWMLTDLMHSHFEDRRHLRVYSALSRIDHATVLFFMGILLAVSALEVAGVLKLIAQFLQTWIHNLDAIPVALGVISAVVDNVPLVAASMNMYTLDQFPQGDDFWNLLAFCAGTGGSILLIGSAPGVALSSLETISFTDYLKKVSWIAGIAYIVGILTYMMIH